MTNYGTVISSGFPNRAKLVLIPNNELVIFTRGAMPNAWVRFWQWLLLGWGWEAVAPPMDEK